MYFEERLEAIEKNQELILKQQAEILAALAKPVEERLTLPQFAEREGIDVNAIRRMVNKRVFPHPVHLVQNGTNKIDWAAYCNWIKDPENAKKMEKPCRAH